MGYGGGCGNGMGYMGYGYGNGDSNACAYPNGYGWNYGNGCNMCSNGCNWCGGGCNGCGNGCNGYGGGCWGAGGVVQQAPRQAYSAQEWEEWNRTPEGQNQYRWWADWIPTPEGQLWCANKRKEAHCVVSGMIQQWGLHNLQAGEGVIDVGGDPGFVAAELLHHGIHVTVVDPAFGYAGKSDAWTTAFLQDQSHWQRVRAGAMPFRICREPFDQVFVDDPKNAELLRGVSAMVSLYPDEATEFLLQYSAAHAVRTALIPCNECKQFFPPHEPTYEGFVKHLLVKDQQHLRRFGQRAPLCREQLWGTPYCQVLLQRSPLPADRPRAAPARRVLAQTCGTGPGPEQRQ